jgi:hypothetical protein
MGTSPRSTPGRPPCNALLPFPCGKSSPHTPQIRPGPPGPDSPRRNTAIRSVSAMAFLAFLIARFSLMDLPNFLLAECRGDLSDMTLLTRASTPSDVTTRTESAPPAAPASPTRRRRRNRSAGRSFLIARPHLAGAGGFGWFPSPPRIIVEVLRPTPVRLAELYLANKPKPLLPSSTPIPMIVAKTTNPRNVITSAPFIAGPTRPARGSRLTTLCPTPPTDLPGRSAASRDYFPL